MQVEYMKKIGALYSRLGYGTYDWVINKETPPWQPLEKPLSECRLALLSSGGIYVSGQVAFHFKDDTSFRTIPREVRTEDLRASHFAYDMKAVRRDPNTVFPIDTLRRLDRRWLCRRHDRPCLFLYGRDLLGTAGQRGTRTETDRTSVG